MSEKSILEMVGGEKHINPHYNIKAEKKGVTMFEKEAEEYADKSKPSFVVNEYGSTVYTLLDIEQAYLAGAEFGYNKANELLEEQIEKMKSLLSELYSELSFSELVKIRNDLPLEIQEVIEEIKEND